MTGFLVMQLILFTYPKSPKFVTPQKITVNTLKFKAFCARNPKVSDAMANSVDPIVFFSIHKCSWEQSDLG